MDELSVAFGALSLNGIFRILDLPSELFSSVCNHLDIGSLLSIRLVSRGISDRSTFTFGTRSLVHLVALPRFDSLSVLLHFARHKKYSRYVKTISISGEIGGSPSIPYVGMPLSTAEDMLTEAFRNFENLETIRIDSFSYVHIHYRSPKAIGLRCGPMWLLSGQLRCDFSALSHLFKVVIESIRRANICDKIYLDLNLLVQEASQYNNFSNSPIQTELFDLGSPFWKERLSLKVRKVELVPTVTSGWASDLAASCPDLKELKLRGHDGRISFDNNHGSVHVWQHLQVLILKDVHLDNTAIVDFLKAHHGTLTHLNLTLVFLDNGTWADILQTIHDLPALESLRLSSLGQSVPYTTAQQPTDELSSVRCCNRSEILLALGALLSDVSTYEEYDSSMVCHEIDFTSANIALSSIKRS
ncbi:uncharacterized protein J4E78_005802 [Alternaria triticimaculans]|uniref:uncharacterized protein n=1 Tax=Alternaria triticimaculans TaxID=297637 RepID=UPI0020C3C251|nr:uncharacterized protein J4E78_005802 [Alternaria triticimaculans]KAI4659375.1 hypothetical protein J4E78_005802 [Alternaria triticimaculans]